MKEPGLDGRHRDRSGEIDRKRSDTLLRTLRDTYGSGFGGNLPDSATLGDLLRRTGDVSLSQYLKRTKK
jgi:hypothetical protein